MRTVVIEKTAFTYEELDYSAQSRVRSWVGEGLGEWLYDDYLPAIRKGLQIFGFDLSDYSFDWSGESVSNWRLSTPHYTAWDRDAEDFTGIRLYKYILNNFADEKPFYIRNKRNKVVSVVPVWDERNDSLDSPEFAFFKPVREFLRKPCKHTTLEDLMNECIEAVLTAGSKEWEYQTSDEAVKEYCEANGYEFDEDGDLI